MAGSAVLSDQFLLAISAFFSVLLVLLYFLHRLRIRRRELSAEFQSRSPIEDRVHNQIRITRSAAEWVERDGTDVSTVRNLLAQAESEADRHRFSTAQSLAQQAHDSLARLRSTPSPGPASLRVEPDSFGAHEAPAAVSPPATIGASNGPVARSPVAPETSGPTSPRTRPPKNQVEAHFELSLLGEELERADSPTRSSEPWSEASDLLTEARTAYDRREYTEALRLSLRGRRKLGSKVESLPVGASSGVPRSFPEPWVEPARVATERAEAGRACPTCQRTNRDSDRFCRSCGAPLGPARCPRCGQALEDEDRFCGACGAPTG